LKILSVERRQKNWTERVPQAEEDEKEGIEKVSRGF